MAQHTEAVPDRDEVAAQRDRIVGSDVFARSARSRDLLRYVVNEALAGRGDRISATTIAQDVLGKGEDFDSGSDPVVRVQMGRMRALLRTWHERNDADVRIDVPKGTYRPTFTRAASDAGDATNDQRAGAAPAPGGPEERTAAPPRERFWLRPGHLVSGALLVLVAVVAALALLADQTMDNRRYPVVVVQPFQNLSGDPANDALAQGLQRQLAADLQRFATVRVALNGTAAPSPLAAEDRSRRRREAAKPDYAVTGAVLSAENDLDFTIDLIDLGDGRLVSRERYGGRADGGYFELIADLSRAATGGLVGSGGAVSRTELARLEDAVALPVNGDLGAFRCLSVFDAFANFKTPEGAERAYRCLDALAKKHPDDPALLGALAWTTALVAPEGGLVEAGTWARALTLDDALALAERAVEVGPGNDGAHEYLGLIQWRMGYRDTGLQSLRRAAALNPGNPHLLADLGLHLAFAGEWREAERLTELAFARSGDPPGWFHLTAMFRAMLDGDARAAARLAERATPGDPYGDIYNLAIAAMAGDDAAIARLRPAVAAHAAANEGDALGVARQWIRSPEILRLLEETLASTGVGVARPAG